MADSTNNESITELVPRTLANWLKENAENLKQTLIGFPEPNLKLNMPSVAVSAPSPDFNPTATPYPLALPTPEDTENPGPTINNHKAEIEWVVGDFEFNLKLDLWARNKEELDDMFDELFNALNPHITPMGVCLKMEDYYDVICDYIYVGHTRGNSEVASQRDEWRMTLDVLATCKAVRSRKEFIIEATEIQAEVNKDVLVTNE